MSRASGKPESFALSAIPARHVPAQAGSRNSARNAAARSARASRLDRLEHRHSGKFAGFLLLRGKLASWSSWKYPCWRSWNQPDEDLSSSAVSSESSASSPSSEASPSSSSSSVSSGLACSRNSLMLLPSAPPTVGRRPTPKMMITITRMIIHSSGPTPPMNGKTFSSRFPISRSRSTDVLVRIQSRRAEKLCPRLTAIIQRCAASMVIRIASLYCDMPPGRIRPRIASHGCPFPFRALSGSGVLAASTPRRGARVVDTEPEVQ